jgi:hypothetical protein
MVIEKKLWGGNDEKLIHCTKIYTASELAL